MPDVYKRQPEGGVGEGWQTILRSKNIYGPYEKKVVLEQGNTTVNGPHQGALVDKMCIRDRFYLEQPLAGCRFSS